MEEVIKVIEKIAEKDIVDYLLVIVPIVISIVAIIISIVTARKQNKIALFERRYSCLFQIKMILNFADTIKDDADERVVLGLYDAFWGTNISNLSGNRQAIEAKCQFKVILKDVEQATFLFNHKFEVLPIDIMKSFNDILFESMGGNINEKTKNFFISLCEKFTEKDFMKIQKKVKL